MKSIDPDEPNMTGPLSFSINPARVLACSAYKKLTWEERGVFFALMGHLWLSEPECQDVLDLPMLSEALGGAEVEAIDRVISVFSRESSEYLTDEISLATNQLLVTSPYLKEQVLERNQCTSITTRESAVIPKSKASTSESNSSSLKGRDDILTVDIKGFCENLQNQGFSGLVPTNQFHDNGLVLKLPQEFLEALVRRYPEINVLDACQDLVRMLVDRPSRCRTISKIPSMVESWVIKRSEEKAAAAVNYDRVEAELDRLLGMSSDAPTHNEDMD